MTGLVMKLLICPTVVFLSGIIFREVYFPTFHAPLLIGLILAAAAHTMEIWTLKPGTLWISTIIDFAAASVIVYLLAWILPGATVTLLGAIYTAFLLALTEYGQHLWLIFKDKTRKA